MSTGDGYGHRWGRNGEFCVAVDPVTRTGGSLTQSVKGAGCYRSRLSGLLGLYASLIGFNPRWLKAPLWDELRRRGPWSVRNLLLRRRTAVIYCRYFTDNFLPVFNSLQ